MIRPHCDKCREELTAYGGLAFSPPGTLPDESSTREVGKFHICARCWTLFMRWLGAGEISADPEPGHSPIVRVSDSPEETSA